MKSLADSNRHLRTASGRREGVERNVRSSSAMEGVSSKSFRSAIAAKPATASEDPPSPCTRGPHLKERLPGRGTDESDS